MTAQEIKQAMQGEWVSIAPEVRPSTIKGPDGSIKPFYLTRAFTYQPNDAFQLTIVNLADACGKTLLARLRFPSSESDPEVFHGEETMRVGRRKQSPDA